LEQKEIVLNLTIPKFIAEI